MRRWGYCFFIQLCKKFPPILTQKQKILLLQLLPQISLTSWKLRCHGSHQLYSTSTLHLFTNFVSAYIHRLMRSWRWFCWEIWWFFFTNQCMSKYFHWSFVNFFRLHHSFHRITILSLCLPKYCWPLNFSMSFSVFQTENNLKTKKCLQAHNSTSVRYACMPSFSFSRILILHQRLLYFIIFGEGILWHFSLPNPFLLNEICLSYFIIWLRLQLVAKFRS